jgi:hypothetical protein
MRGPLLLLLLMPLLVVGWLPSSVWPSRCACSPASSQSRPSSQKVGGEHVDARAMVRPGFNPHTYDPTPQQIAALAGAVLYVRTGVPFEHAWMERIRSANPDMQVIDARDGIDLREMEAMIACMGMDEQWARPSMHERHANAGSLEHGADHGTRSRIPMSGSARGWSGTWWASFATS